MRRAIIPIALVLALVTGLVLSELRLVALAPLGTDGASAHAIANSATVRRFYDAVNHTIVTGNTALLDDVLAADFVEHPARPGLTGDRSGLVRYLQALHRTEPEILLTGHDLVAEGDRVSAVVRIEGAIGMPAVGLPAVTGRAWGTVDVFRLRAGRIAEHWGDDLGLGMVEPLLAVDVPVEPPATKWVEVARLTYPSGGSERYWASGPTILIVESGSLNVEHDPISNAAATVIPVSGTRWSLSPGGKVRLSTGDALVLDRLSQYEPSNDEMTPTVVLVVRSGSPSNLAYTSSADATPLPAPPAPPAPGPTDVTLAGSRPASFPDGHAGVAIGRISLAPGAVLARHQVEYAEYVVVESGSLALTMEDGKGWVRPQLGAASRVAASARMETGAGLAFDASSTVAFAPAGNAPLVVLVISIGPPVEDSASIS